jgi:hypothetical protein
LFKEAVKQAFDLFWTSAQTAHDPTEREKLLRACGRHLARAETLIKDSHAEPAADRQLREAAAAKWKAEGGRVRGNAPWLADDIKKVFNGEIPLNDQWRRALRELLDAPAPLSGKQLFTAVQFALRADERDARRKLAASVGMLVPALERILTGEKSPTEDQVDKLRAYAEAARQRKAEPAAPKPPIAATEPAPQPYQHPAGAPALAKPSHMDPNPTWLPKTEPVVLLPQNVASSDGGPLPEENRLWVLWQTLKPNTRGRCVAWIEENCPAPFALLDDTHTIREAAAPFRALAKQCTEAEIAQFVELTKATVH